MPERKIVWEKWSDPIAVHLNRRHDDDQGNLMVFKEDSLEHIDLDNPCALTRIGVVPYHESNSPGKLFKFWVGHTNFDIGLNEARAIEAELGVESLDVYTRYRFRVGIGRQFGDDAVKKGIEVGVGLGNRPTALSHIIATMRACPTPWAVAVYPGGGVKVVRAATPEEVHYSCRILQQQGQARIITEEDLP